MIKRRNMSETGSEASSAAQDRKKRLAEALRRNLVRRKDKKELQPKNGADAK